MTDQEFINTIQSDDRIAINRALKELYRLNYDSIRNLVSKTKGTDDDAADVFQQAIMVVYDQIRLKKFLGNASLKTYLYAVSRNLWFKTLKQRSMEVNVEDVGALMSGFTQEETETAISFHKKKLTLTHLLEQLGGGCKKVLKDFYYNGMSLHEIATKHNLANDATAKNKKYRCIVKLMQLVKDLNIEMQDLHINER